MQRKYLIISLLIAPFFWGNMPTFAQFNLHPEESTATESEIDLMWEEFALNATPDRLPENVLELVGFSQINSETGIKGFNTYVYMQPQVWEGEMCFVAIWRTNGHQNESGIEWNINGFRNWTVGWMRDQNNNCDISDHTEIPESAALNVIEVPLTVLHHTLANAQTLLELYFEYVENPNGDDWGQEDYEPQWLEDNKARLLELRGDPTFRLSSISDGQGVWYRTAKPRYSVYSASYRSPNYPRGPNFSFRITERGFEIYTAAEWRE